MYEHRCKQLSHIFMNFCLSQTQRVSEYTYLRTYIRFMTIMGGGLELTDQILWRQKDALSKKKI